MPDQPSNATTPFVCKDCRMLKTNWYGPCPHAPDQPSTESLERDIQQVAWGIVHAWINREHLMGRIPQKSRSELIIAIAKALRQQNAALVSALRDLLNSDGHTTRCNFTGCTCGRTEVYRAKRDVAISALAHYTPAEEAQSKQTGGK